MHSWLQFLGAGFVSWYGFDASHFQGFLLKVKLENQNLTGMKKPATYPLITTFGIKENEYSKELVHSHLDMDILFSN